MTDSDAHKAKFIFELVREGESNAIKCEITAAAKLAGEQEGERRWRAEEDRAFDRCPYNTDHAERALERAKEQRARWADLVTFAFERFIKE